MTALATPSGPGPARAVPVVTRRTPQTIGLCRAANASVPDAGQLRRRRRAGLAGSVAGPGQVGKGSPGGRTPSRRFACPQGRAHAWPPTGWRTGHD